MLHQLLNLSFVTDCCNRLCTAYYMTDRCPSFSDLNNLSLNLTGRWSTVKRVFKNKIVPPNTI